VAGWAAEIVVVDSGSIDATVDIARSCGAHVIHHDYEGPPAQWRWILNNVSLKSEWVLALDADHVVTGELRAAIEAELKLPRYDGYYLAHRQVFRGRVLRHGGMYPRRRLCLFRQDRVTVDPLDLVDPHFVVANAGQLPGDLVEDNPKDRDLSSWIEKQVRFASAAAQEESVRRTLGREAFMRLPTSSGRNKRVVWAKYVWLRLPLYWRSASYFLYRYVVRFGFLDGKEGYLYHLTQALVYRTMVDAALDRPDRKGSPADGQVTVSK
jgi:glycosyltransferase involved in cell wall biosynthesis